MSSEPILIKTFDNHLLCFPKEFSQMSEYIKNQFEIFNLSPVQGVRSEAYEILGFKSHKFDDVIKSLQHLDLTDAIIEIPKLSFEDVIFTSNDIFTHLLDYVVEYRAKIVVNNSVNNRKLSDWDKKFSRRGRPLIPKEVKLDMKDEDKHEYKRNAERTFLSPLSNLADFLIMQDLRDILIKVWKRQIERQTSVEKMRSRFAIENNLSTEEEEENRKLFHYVFDNNK